MKTETRIVVTLEVEGTHAWPECPLPEVSFLRDPHRHLFKIRAEKRVSHDDRDVEIIMLKREMKKHLVSEFQTVGTVETCDFGRLSCESIAARLVHEFGLASCEVLEDGENGAVVTATP